MIRIRNKSSVARVSENQSDITMKFPALFAMLMAVFALFLSAGQAAPAPEPEPKIPIKPIIKGIVRTLLIF